MSKLLTLLTILVSMHAFAAAVPAPITKTNTSKVKVKKKVAAETPTYKTWDNTITAEYTPETSDFVSSNMFYVGDFNYRTSYTHRFRWFQRVLHQIIPDTGKENGGQTIVYNPRLQYFYNFQEPQDKSYHLALRLSNEFGTSITAQEDGIKMIPNLRLEFDKRFGFMTVSLRPYVSYWVTDFSTNKLGDPLPMFTVGHNFYMLVNFTKKFSWAFELDTAFQMFQSADVKDAQSFNPNPNAGPLETSKTVLYLGTDLGYSITKSFLMRVGYYQFDKFTADGKYDLELLNNKTTRFFVGMDYYF